MTSSCAYFLVFHGSRDCRTQTAALKLRNLLIAKYQSNHILTQDNCLGKSSFDFEPKLLTNGHPQAPSFYGGVRVTEPAISDLPRTPLIEIAALELADKSLSQSLIDFAQKANLQGFKRIKVLPLFLAPGSHVQSDIPAEIALAIKQFDNQVSIELSPYLGKYSGIVSLLTNQFDELSSKTRILIAHGSKLLAAEEYYQNLSKQLHAEIAYWSTFPKFTQQIKAQILSGSQKIAILPYFLFPGKITEAIATKIDELQQEYPHVELLLGKPLGATPAIAELIAQSA
ncbi:MAG: sirohydrochlorin chelatase [Pleurocapsa sp. SU_5_0]|nr:sirohydrochlorin chelatase [Pleurocapsa sp. SU_5_0]